MGNTAATGVRLDVQPAQEGGGVPGGWCCLSGHAVDATKKSKDDLQVLSQVVSPTFDPWILLPSMEAAQDIYRKAREELGRMPGMKPGVVERRLVGGPL